MDLRGLHRAVRQLLVHDRDLSLAVGTQPPEGTILANICELLAQLGGNGMRKGQAILGLIRSIAEHNALIAGTHVKIRLADMNATCDVWALLVDAHKDLAGLVTQPLAVHAREIVDVAVEADLLHHAAHDLVVVEIRLADMDATCDVWALLVDAHKDLAGLVTQPLAPC